MTASMMETTAASGLKRYHQLLAVQSLVVVLLSVNRLSSLTLGYVAANQFLRWVDFNNMLVLPLASTVAFYLLKKHVEAGGSLRQGGSRLLIQLAFIVGVYLLAAGYGNHEITNYLHVRFCPSSETSILCQIVIFNDDEFSHWVFFIGFVLINAAVMFLQVVHPYPGKVSRADRVLLAINGFFIGAGIFANLAFETIGLDLLVVAVLAILAAGLLWRRGLQPLLLYYTVAYWLGLLATALYKALL